MPLFVTRPQIGIAIPIYNVAFYLRECINSLKNQTFRDFFVVLVDDGSTDQSRNIAIDLIKDDPRFVLIEQKNGGVSKARNAALDYFEKINPKYLAFLDSDDYVDPEWLDIVNLGLEKEKATMCFFGIQSFDLLKKYENSSILPGIEYVGREDILKCFFSQGRFSKDSRLSFKLLCNKVFKYDLVKDLRFDEDLALGEDQKYCLTIFDRCEKAVLIPENYYFYRMRQSSATNRVDKDHLFNVYAVYKDALFECKTQQEKKLIFTELLSLYRIALENGVNFSLYQKYRRDFYLPEKRFLLEFASGKMLSARNTRRINALKLPEILLILFVQIRIKLRNRHIHTQRMNYYQ